MKARHVLCFCENIKVLISNNINKIRILNVIGCAISLGAFRAAATRLLVIKQHVILFYMAECL